jgi:hypothetical protein
MKHEWKIRREVQEDPSGQSRWDRAYQLILGIARSVELDQIQTTCVEVQHASSNLCPSLDLEASPNTNH